MSYFISKNQYFNFSEYPKYDNIVNKLVIPVASISEDNTETVFASTKNNKYATKYKTSDAISMPLAYDIEQIIPLSLTYQSNSEEISKYSTINYRVKALKVNTFKESYFPTGINVFNKEKVRVQLLWYGSNNDNRITDINDATEEDYDTLFSGVCNISSGNLCTFGPDISQYNFLERYTASYNNYLGNDASGLGVVTSVVRQYTANFYTNFYVEFVGVKKNINYGESTVLSNVSNPVLFSYNIDQNSFIQNGTTYNGESIVEYIPRVTFKNYENCRPVATLEWVGSPDVNIGTELQIEPRKEYDKEGLTTYTVVGKDISYDGGYRETLYLIKKEAD